MLTADQNFRLLQEIEENRRFLLMAYQQNPRLLENAEARIKQLFDEPAHGVDYNLPSDPRPLSSERGISLIELIMFIVIISVALAGILGVMNRVTGHSADTLIRKQSLAIAESLLEEVGLMPFTYCDPDDANATTATSAVVGAGGCATTLEGIGPEGGETRYSNANPFDNVSDYDGCRINGAANAGCDAAGNSGIKDVTGTVVSTALNGYSAAITVTALALAGITAASGDALLINVTVTGPDNEQVTLEGYRTRHSPNSVP